MPGVFLRFFSEINLFNDECSRHIKTSQLICSSNQLNGYYMMRTLAVNELISLDTCILVNLKEISFGKTFSEEAIKEIHPEKSCFQTFRKMSTHLVEAILKNVICCASTTSLRTYCVADVILGICKKLMLYNMCEYLYWLFLLAFCPIKTELHHWFFFKWNKSDEFAQVLVLLLGLFKVWKTIYILNLIEIWIFLIVRSSHPVHYPSNRFKEELCKKSPG